MGPRNPAGATQPGHHERGAWPRGHLCRGRQQSELAGLVRLRGSVPQRGLTRWVRPMTARARLPMLLVVSATYMGASARCRPRGHAATAATATQRRYASASSKRGSTARGRVRMRRRLLGRVTAGHAVTKRLDTSPVQALAAHAGRQGSRYGRGYPDVGHRDPGAQRGGRPWRENRPGSLRPALETGPPLSALGAAHLPPNVAHHHRMAARPLQVADANVARLSARRSMTPDRAHRGRFGPRYALNTRI
jgi:hypothetical protein